MSGPATPGQFATGLVATDLDRTLIYSRTAMGESQFADVDPVCVEIYQDAPLSYMTRRAHGLLAQLTELVPVIPVTTRTPAQFGRITLPGSPFRHAVVSSGGRVLCDGADDAAWRAHIERRVAATSAPLAEVTAGLAARIDDGWVRSLRTADDLFCYIVVDLDGQPATFLDDWRAWCAAREWTVSQQGRKIYALPREVTKSAALAHVRERLVDDGTLATENEVYAAGDGRLDIDLLTYADAAVRPCHGELEQIGWTRPDLTITSDPGALGGEQIVEWFLARVGADARMGT
ncbi:hypothetical protein GPOL_c49430 [Gordonia polyisoprenivorans VH2]|uniref:HAD family hydrolase n=2 Tax=Gordonia polyisoprenivorans TaxID=84595 RepID=H6N265_GORPV|nr:hypothetical protein [Gordonia polyisoprenivorans]AFA75937.1 hypothetical protein GPOL_c49430 [Gordonia polyisoprenivorans VH2]OZC32946.1 HAD family hydrolase [Gordonia polyisoprenivorans]